MKSFYKKHQYTILIVILLIIAPIWIAVNISAIKKAEIEVIETSNGDTIIKTYKVK